MQKGEQQNFRGGHKLKRVEQAMARGGSFTNDLKKMQSGAREKKGQPEKWSNGLMGKG